ncbi:xylulokinase [Zhihengliuella salsuginis]|uniref:ATPase n=1 Tax=Zhihengliuella salsuginis TaxID=578222 RepID=A0ABQ3GFB9_9MICC|nr:FGGY-family carbohydrate kinase [Zhihengliuella salsuginis]GHD04217.1 ATPase [Zhihengliuella salsuginis]
MDSQRTAAVREAITAGRTTLGIELGSTNIKASLIGEDHAPVASGSHGWENRFEGRTWTYPLESVWEGLAAAYAALCDDVESRFGVRPASFDAIGVSAMMHGYLAFSAADELLVPFRTWRNTTTGDASGELTDRFGYNIPLRWSIAHLHQAVLDDEAHVSDVDFFTTLAGYVHWQLTGCKVLGVGDASGMFPIDPATGGYDAGMLATYDSLAAERRAAGRTAPPAAVVDLMPEVLTAGADAGVLTESGARLLDPSGALRPGIPLCPPEGDAGTGMVATNSVAPRTGNVSAGTSIFAMVVLEQPLSAVHHELDMVTTPSGDLVAMVHCNNGASELAAWAGLFGEFAAALGTPAAGDDVFGALFAAALEGEADGGGLIAYNYLSGEPITGLDEGRPLFARTPDSTLSLANFMRTQVYAVFGTLSLGMKVLDGEGVRLDAMFAHGGLFKTAGVAQRFLAAALGAPVAVGTTAGEGGAWGIAVLAAYRRAVLDGAATGLGGYLTSRVFAGTELDVVAPDPADEAGYAAFLERYEAGLAVERAAAENL